MCFFSVHVLIYPPCLSGRITSLHLSIGLPILHCPFTSTFLVLATTSSSDFLSTWPDHPSFVYPISSLMFTTPALIQVSPVLIFSVLFIPIVDLNSLIYVLSSMSCSAYISARVSLPCIRTDLMTVLSIMGILLSNTIPDLAFT